MARKIPMAQAILTPEEQLTKLVPDYGKKKAEFDVLKKDVDGTNAKIKSIMTENGLDNFSAGGFKASVSISNRESFNEELLLNTLKGMKDIPEGLIKTREYADMDALEAAIYNAKVDAAKLQPCQETKEVVTLRIKAEKKEE